jgi:anti-anti-sigma factor
MSVASSITARRDGGTVTLLISEHFDYQCVHAFRKAWEQNMCDDVNFVVDFSATRHIDSCALGLLMSLHKFLARQQLQLTLINCSEHVRKVFSIVHFDKKLRIE